MARTRTNPLAQQIDHALREAWGGLAITWEVATAIAGVAWRRWREMPLGRLRSPWRAVP